MDNSIIFLLFSLIFILMGISFFYFKKIQDKDLRDFFKEQRKKSENSLDLLTTFDLIKELKKRQNPPVFIGWIDRDDNNRINYFIFRKNIEKTTSLIILQKMIEDIRKFG